MATKILIPTPLRGYTDQLDEVEAEGATVGELLANLTTRYADLRKHLYAEDGTRRNFVNIYLNDDDIRYLEKDQTPVTADDTVSIIQIADAPIPVSHDAVHTGQGALHDRLLLRVVEYRSPGHQTTDVLAGSRIGDDADACHGIDGLTGRAFS